ncbi:MAG: hypothetical protein K2W95_03645 [Candidatus Obscuribacterales bacterium]|nr:hypothetical protein [Candidatus Obscuribacterales bacterium]
MKRLTRNEMLALLAIAGVASGACAVNAAEKSGSTNIAPMGVVEHPTMSRLGSDSACGAGACGADDKGAAAAKKKHDKGDKKTPDKSADKKKSEKSDKKTEK